MSALTFEQRAAVLGELVVQAERTHPDLNEATTRLRFIDVLLFDALGWNREHCINEEPLDGTYTDYSLGKPASQLVVEAKREGIYFNLPVGTGPLVVPLATLTRGNEQASKAVEQAHGYCVQRGVRLAAVTNGNQLIAFLGSRDDGTPPLRGRAVVFRSLREMEDRFIDLWNFLSPDGVAEGNLQALLKAEGRPLPPEKLSQRMWTYPGVKNRNEIEIELEILGDLFLQEIVSTNDVEDDFLRECYLPSGALSQYALVSRDILRTRYHETVNRNQQQVIGATTNTGVSPELRNAVTERGVSRKPIVLLGDVGVGKTTFVRHLVRIDAKQELERSIVFYIDFGSRPALRRDLEAFVREAFAQQLIDEYGIDIFADDFVRAVYNAELNRFSRSIYKTLEDTDPGRYFDEQLKLLANLTGTLESHLRRSLQHLQATEQRNAVVFFDNIDQRDLEFQDSVYLIAQSLADGWDVTTFVSLRPETFNASRRAGSLSAYQPRVFTISPPRIDRVIVKRLEFALSAIENGRFNLAADGITVDSYLLKDYIRVLINSLHRNEALSECLDNVSRGNVRKALDLLSSFVGSGHVDTRKIISLFQRTGRYIIPLHEFLRAIIYGDGEYFDPNASPVANLFDISSNSGREHFLTPILINYLERSAQHGGVEFGFVRITSAYEFCQSVGFTVDEIDFAITRSVNAGLIESSVGSASNRAVGADRLRVTQNGAYAIRRLMSSFVYYDAVVVDTPIVSDEWRPRIAEARLIAERLDRAESFAAYLEEQFAAMTMLETGFDFGGQLVALRGDIAEVRLRVERAERRRQSEDG